MDQIDFLLSRQTSRWPAGPNNEDSFVYNGPTVSFFTIFYFTLILQGIEHLKKESREKDGTWSVVFAFL